MTAASILLVHADASALAGAIRDAMPELTVRPAESLVAARAYLVGTSFDVILAQAVLADGPAVSLLELDVHVPPLIVRADSLHQRTEAEHAGADLAFAAEPHPVVLAAVLADFVGLGAEVDDLVDEGEDREGDELQTVADELARLTHALNNPLAVIVGNAQLIRELYAMDPADEMVPSSLADIETAASELVALVDEVKALRRWIDDQQE